MLKDNNQAMSKASSHLPAGFHTLTVHLTANGASQYIGKSYGSGQAVRLTLYLPDADATWEKALAAGCKVLMPIRDQFWGDRYGEVEDSFGYVWAIATHKEDLATGEIEERRKKMFGGGKPHHA